MCTMAQTSRPGEYILLSQRPTHENPAHAPNQSNSGILSQRLPSSLVKNVKRYHLPWNPEKVFQTLP